MSDRAHDLVLGFLSSPGKAGDFEDLAMTVFEHQYRTNPPYRLWCERADRSPDNVRSSDDIPAVPTEAFKELNFVCGTASDEFRTSGSTGTSVGRHLVPSLEPYRLSALEHFRRRVLPDGKRIRIVVLAPPPGVRPTSSLSRMFAWIVGAFGDGESGWYVSGSGLERERLAASLIGIQKGGEAVLMAGTTAALLSFLDYCDGLGVRFNLPAGSVLVDTGGQKGSGIREVIPLGIFQRNVYGRVSTVLGIPEEMCVNEYGMTEMFSQFYDAGEPGRWGLDYPRTKLGPPWVRTSVVDPVTLAPCPPGETGLLRHLDLANVGSVMAILTEDLGRSAGEGFVLEGRPRAAAARGCGLTFEELAGFGSGAE